MSRGRFLEGEPVRLRVEPESRTILGRFISRRKAANLSDWSAFPSLTMTKKKLFHFAPVFANLRWSDEEGYVSFYRDAHEHRVKSSRPGPRQWGRKKGLWSKAVEDSLEQALETRVARLVSRTLAGEQMTSEDRLLWGQFLLSQHVRTPCFMRYEKLVKADYHGPPPAHDRVGCPACGDLLYLLGRTWGFLVAHPEDFFIRTDNPVLLTGFIERPSSALFYPMSPRVCFTACSMPDSWSPTAGQKRQSSDLYAIELTKGAAHFLNFHCIRSADESIAAHPRDQSSCAQMCSDVLGVYPQPPFGLHHVHPHEMDTAFESIRSLMTVVDRIDYPKWLPHELEPFSIRMERRFSEGIQG